MLEMKFGDNNIIYDWKLKRKIFTIEYDRNP